MARFVRTTGGLLQLEERQVTQADYDRVARFYTGLRPAESGESWSGGRIYDPTSGRQYRAAASLDGRDRLQVRGYLGIRLLGRTTVWTRVQPSGDLVCRADR